MSQMPPLLAPFSTLTNARLHIMAVKAFTEAVDALLQEVEARHGNSPTGRMELRMIAVADDPPADPIAETFLSPLERQIILAIGTGEKLGKEIAQATGHLYQHRDGRQAKPKLLAVLDNLCERGLLAHEDGYRVSEQGLIVLRRLGILP